MRVAWLSLSRNEERMKKHKAKVKYKHNNVIVQHDRWKIRLKWYNEMCVEKEIAGVY